jgi:uncharacterized protein (DUF1800 family)
VAAVPPRAEQRPGSDVCEGAAVNELSPLPQVAFDREAAAHLLRRLQFGVRPDEIDRALAEGLPATADRLLSVQPETDAFVRAEAALRQTAYAASSIAGLKAWWLYRMLHSANPLREKLTLMWHNHFATSHAKVNNVPQMAVQNDLFREHAWGDFHHLLHGVARDPAMLVWLDGNANRRRHPNENFAREVMELFALGLGNYTERDIQEAARAFTGWQLRDGAFWFNASQHDAAPKTIFGRTGRFEGSHVIDLCLEHPACPRFLAFKLLRQFVSDQPSTPLIDLVAASLARHKLRIRPVLFELVTSAAFFADEHRQALIKSPVDLVVGTLRTSATRVVLPAAAALLARLGQDLFEPPTVKGWDGGRQWIQTSTWILRWNFVTELVDGTGLGALREQLWTDGRPQPDTWLLTYLGRVAPEVRAAVVAHWEAADELPAGRARRALRFLWSLPEYQLA